MKLTTLCYLEKAEQWLMLYRNKKKEDINAGKWIGVGGKLEKGESPEECLVREVWEETGLTLTGYEFLGIISFINDCCEDEYMLLYRGFSWEGSLRSDCPEGELAWIPKQNVLQLPLWEGDQLFLRRMLAGESGIHLKLIYHGDRLVEAIDSKEACKDFAGKENNRTGEVPIP